MTAEPLPALPPEVAAVLRQGAHVIVCLRKCWPCQFGECAEPGTWHTWADLDDIEYAKAAGQPDPSIHRCGCPCAGTGDRPEPVDALDLAAGRVDLDGQVETLQPCPVCGEGICGYDAEGRPLAHVVTDTDT